MGALSKFILQNKEVATAVATIIVALLAHFFGFWKFVGEEISKELAHRREVGKMTPRTPKNGRLCTSRHLLLSDSTSER